jgi:hypothetical protein
VAYGTVPNAAIISPHLRAQSSASLQKTLAALLERLSLSV